jgi:cephalosporin hydroxylase
VNDELEFNNDVKSRIAAQGKDIDLVNSAEKFLEAGLKTKYIYNFSWLGRPIIQTPQDIVALQEIIFKTKPDVIIDIGIARGGSIVFFASMLELNALYGSNEDAKVLGIEIDLRSHNRNAIKDSPLSKRIEVIDGSSLSPEVITQVASFIKNKKNVMVCLDSLHTHAHVLAELEVYSKFVTSGAYCIVFDTSIEGMDDSLFEDRPWKTGNSPGSAVREFLSREDNFYIDESINNQLIVTMNKNGYLKRV